MPTDSATMYPVMMVVERGRYSCYVCDTVYADHTETYTVNGVKGYVFSTTTDGGEPLDALYRRAHAALTKAYPDDNVPAPQEDAS